MKSKRKYMPRVRPSISTSSKTFVDKKTKSKFRRKLKEETAEIIRGETQGLAFP